MTMPERAAFSLSLKIISGLALSLLVLFAGRQAGKIFFLGSPEPLRPLPDFRMTAVTTKGEGSLGKSDLQGRPWIADFIFTHCSGPCPLLSAEMAELQKDLPKEVRLVTFTVDPDRDNPEVLRKYAARFGADPERWFFLTGEKSALYKLMAEGFNLPIAEDVRAPSGFRVTHSAKFVLVDSNGILRGYYSRDGIRSLKRLRGDALGLIKGG